MKKRWLTAVLIGTTFLPIVSSPQSWAVDGGPIVVIVNQANPVQNVTMAELRKIFLSDRNRWDTGKNIAPVIAAPGTAERVAFLKIVCGMRDAEFSKYFLQAAFTGKDVTPPREVLSSRDVKTTVAASPGAMSRSKNFPPRTLAMNTPSVVLDSAVHL